MEKNIIPEEFVIEKVKEKYPDYEIGFGENGVEYPRSIYECTSVLSTINPEARFYPAIILKKSRFLYAIIKYSINGEDGINIPNFVSENTYDVRNNENGMCRIELGVGEKKSMTFFKLLEI